MYYLFGPMLAKRCSILALPAFTLPFVVNTDACESGVGWILSNKYLAHKPFEILTDYRALVFIKSMRLPSMPRLTRMSLFLQGYNFSINYKPGSQNTAADALSRIPREDEIITPDNSEVIAMIN